MALYHDYKTATAQKVAVGVGDPVYILPSYYSDGSRAEEAAEAQFNYFKRHHGQFSITLIDKPAIMAQFPLSLSGVKTDIDVNWIIDKTTHQLIPSKGYLTQIAGSIRLKTSPTA